MKLFINLDNAVTVTRNENDVAERGNRDQVYIDQAAGAAQDFYGQAKETASMLPRWCAKAPSILRTMSAVSRLGL